MSERQWPEWYTGSGNCTYCDARPIWNNPLISNNEFLFCRPCWENSELPLSLTVDPDVLHAERVRLANIISLLDRIAAERDKNGLGDLDSALGRDGAIALETLVDTYASF